MADEFVVDGMLKACGLSFEDLKLFMHRVEHGGKPINVIDLYGLRATKQTARARDIEDLRHIEVALAALRGEVSNHVKKTSGRPPISEPEPPKRGIEPRLQGSENIDVADHRLELAAKIIERAKRWRYIVDRCRNIGILWL